MTITIDSLLRDMENTRRQRKRRTQAQVQDRTRTQAQASSDAPYRAVAIVLPLREQRCACGNCFTHPEGPLLVQFQHRRTTTSLYIANHPSQFNARLPRRILVNRSSIEHCPSCFASSTPDIRRDEPWLFPELAINAPGGQAELPLPRPRRLLPDAPPPRHSHDR